MFRNPYADVIVALVVVLLFFGPKRLPTLGRSLGQGLREFKDSISGTSQQSDAEQPAELTAANPAPARPVASAAQPVASAAQPVASAPERESAEVSSPESR
jgi:sec-independent protein translocase protein TatA